MRSFLMKLVFLVAVALAPLSASATAPCVGTGCVAGTAGTGITPPAGATGAFGWLSGIYSQLQTLVTQTAALSGMPTISSVTSVNSTTAATVITAGSKNFWRVTNANTTGDLACTDDGSTPTATHWTIRIFATVMYEAMRPGFVSSAAVQCIGISPGVTVNLVGGQY